MRGLLTILLTVLFLFPEVYSQGQIAFEPELPGRGAYSRSFADVFSGLHNQASLADLKNFTAGIFLRERFSMKALGVAHFAAALPLSSGTFSFQGMSGGYHDFKRQQLTLAYARKLFDWLNLGAEIDYLNMRVPEYGGADAVTFALSALFHIRGKWHVGVQIFNPEKVSYRKLGADRIPAVYLAGLGYQPSDIFLLTAEVRFSENNADGFGFVTFQYHIAKALTIKTGISTGATPVFAGIQLHLRPVEILLSATFHEQLGLSPGAGFLFINKPAGDEL